MPWKMARHTLLAAVVIGGLAAAWQWLATPPAQEAAQSVSPAAEQSERMHDDDD